MVLERLSIQVKNIYLFINNFFFLIVHLVFALYMNESEISEMKKIHQKFFINYMKRRTEFLSSNHQFKENNFGVTQDKKYKNLAYLRFGSILMETMLHEADNFFNRNLRVNWSSLPHIYLIYDEQSFKVLALDKNKREIKERIQKLESLDLKFITDPLPMIPDREQLKKKSNLIKYLSIALNTRSEKISSIINSNNYVLTLDYCLKMILIHERQLVGMPTIIMVLIFFFSTFIFLIN